MSNGRSEPRQLLQPISTYFSFGFSFSPCQVPTVSWCLKKASFSGEAQVDDHQSSYGALPRGLCSQVLDQNELSGSKWCTTFHVLVQASRVVFHPDKADVDGNGIVSRQEFERLSSTSLLKTQNMADHDRSKISYATNGVLCLAGGNREILTYTSFRRRRSSINPGMLKSPELVKKITKNTRMKACIFGQKER